MPITFGAWRTNDLRARRGEVIRFEVDFVPHSFEKAGVEQTKDDIKARLTGHEFARLKIILKKRLGNQIELQFVGDPQDVERARRLLGIY
ncbi:MAG TPA: hypothetical protein VJU77_03700 [Chthoniobacterales bacterium]|nr:hypothetical protein [Chthoniobacterales bacterium]